MEHQEQFLKKIAEISAEITDGISQRILGDALGRMSEAIYNNIYKKKLHGKIYEEIPKMQKSLKIKLSSQKKK